LENFGNCWLFTLDFIIETTPLQGGGVSQKTKNTLTTKPQHQGRAEKALSECSIRVFTVDPKPYSALTIR